MDEQLLRKRLLELANRSFSQNTYIFTEFLDISQISCFYELQNQLNGIPFAMNGGADVCERRMIRFGSPELFGYETEYPICCIRISPVAQKFAEDLSHRDFLGALMNLGIERDTLGDIFVVDNEAFLFCTEGIAPYIVEELNRIKHTPVRCLITDMLPDIMETKLERVEETVASERLDAVISKIYKLSRAQSIELFRRGCVYVNGRICEQNAYLLKPDDVVSVRGFGKFEYEGVLYHNKKDRLRIVCRIRK